jgi:ABC-type amino acid transport substrate-binding protein
LIATMLTTAAALLLLAVVLAGCQSTANLPLSPLPEQLKLTSKVAHAKAAKATRTPKAARAAKLGRAATPAKPVEPAETNPPALGVKLLGEELRVVLLQERLRGLCEVVKVEQLSADSWRASCAKGDAFVVKVYPDGFMSLTRS